MTDQEPPAVAPTASIVIPTRGRPDYLDVTLASIVPQASDADAEVLVVNDGDEPAARAVASRHGAHVIRLREPSGANAARNAGVAEARGPLLVFIDDDIEAPPGWLDAIIAGARDAPEVDVFGGPIRARLEGGGPRACGREPAPITTLELGAVDRDVAMVWSANMAVRRVAFERIGPFDEVLAGSGEEEDWLRRYAAQGGRVRYLVGAGVDHRRTAADATLSALSRTAYGRGRAARRYDTFKGTQPPLAGELRTLAGCAWHIVRRRCASGVVLFAHSAGRVREALAERGTPAAPAPPRSEEPAPIDDFLSGASGQVAGIRLTSRAIATDLLQDAVVLARLEPWRLRRAAARWPRRKILALGVERTDVPNLLAAARAELERSRHEVRFAQTTAGDRGKFENLQALLATHPVDDSDWLLVIDDDVSLPPGFLDAFIFLAERFSLRLAQPAHRRRSHAAWEVTRRQTASVVRETAFVEIGPVFAFQAATFGTLLPFPPLRVGWGLDAHWSAVAREHGWKLGVIDATPVGHGLRPIAASYDRTGAIEEGRSFLAGRPYTRAAEARRTLVVHRSW
jgi:GT2 family glycosyltransferase